MLSIIFDLSGLVLLCRVEYCWICNRIVKKHRKSHIIYHNSYPKERIEELRNRLKLQDQLLPPRLDGICINGLNILIINNSRRIIGVNGRDYQFHL